MTRHGRPPLRLGWLLCAALLACTAPGGQPAAGADLPAAGSRPNVVLLMADDLGYGDVGFLGNAVIATPHLDAMAADGLVLKRFYAAAPVCSPTRGSVLTGRHPYRYGIRGANQGHLPAGEVNLARLLRGAGYRTGHFGKWHLGTLTRTVKESNRGGPRGAAHYAPPWERDFDVCFSTEAKVPTFDPMLKPGTSEPYGTFYWTGEERRAEDHLEGDDSRIIMDRVLPFVRAAVAEERPFFAVVWFHAPHLPILAGPRQRERYAAHPGQKPDYYGCITALDEQVGRLRAELRELGVDGNTLLWFCSDNGPEGKTGELGQTGGLRGRKRSLYEGGVRVPAVAVWPERIRPGTVTDCAAVTTDTLPTVLEAAGLPLPEGRVFDGQSLLALFAGQVQRREGHIGFESSGQLAFTGQRYKLVRPIKKAAFELYDLEADPGEQRDLAAQMPERVDELVLALEEWRASCRRDAEALNAGH